MLAIGIGGDQDFLYFVCIDGISYMLKFEHVLSIPHQGMPLNMAMAPNMRVANIFCILFLKVRDLLRCIGISLTSVLLG